jgi:hypothetical protein
VGRNWRKFACVLAHGIKVPLKVPISARWFGTGSFSPVWATLRFTGNSQINALVRKTGKLVPLLHWLSTTPWWHMGSGGIAPPLLTLALGGDKWSVSRPGRFSPWEIFSYTHWVRGWVVSSAGLGVVEKRRVTFHCRELNPHRPACNQSLYRLSYLGCVCVKYGSHDESSFEQMKSDFIFIRKKPVLN